MNTRLTLVFGVINVVVAILLLAVGPIVADHQALAFSGYHHGHGGAYGFYGPCIIHGFSYTWCLNRF